MKLSSFKSSYDQMRNKIGDERVEEKKNLKKSIMQKSIEIVKMTKINS